ncbi:MAG: lysylphosphatidylglycerol synthase transmembrane domain-containing protein [Candidatus Humimicrobiaceae bacterium]
MAIDKKKLKNILFTALRIVISAGILIFLFKTQFKNFSEITDFFRHSHVNIRFVVISLIMYWVGISLLVLRWQILLKTQKIKASFGFLLGSYLVGFFFNNFLPTSIGGDVYRIYDTSKLKHSSGMKAASIVLMERTTGIVSSIIYLFFALAIGFVKTSQVELKVGKWDVSNHLLIILIIVFFAVSILVTLVMLFPDAFRLNKLFRKLKFLHKWEDKLKQVYDTFKSFRKFKLMLLVTIALSLVLQFAFTLNYSFAGMGFGITKLSILSYIFIVQLCGILSMIPISIGGIGVREGTFVILVGALGGEKNIAAIVSIAILIMILIPGVVGGIIYALRPYIDKKRAAIAEAQYTSLK